MLLPSLKANRPGFVPGITSPVILVCTAVPILAKEAITVVAKLIRSPTGAPNPSKSVIVSYKLLPIRDLTSVLEPALNPDPPPSFALS